MSDKKPGADRSSAPDQPKPPVHSPEVQRALDQAEQIRREGQGSGQSSPGASPDPQAGAGGRADTPAPPSPSINLGRIVVALADHGFCLVFGPGSELKGELRKETEDNLNRALEHSAPMVKQLGPWSAVGICLGAHALGRALERGWITPENVSSVATQDQAKPHS